jgi:hypothetical protein
MTSGVRLCKKRQQAKNVEVMIFRNPNRVDRAGPTVRLKKTYHFEVRLSTPFIGAGTERAGRIVSQRRVEASRVSVLKTGGPDWPLCATAAAPPGGCFSQNSHQKKGAACAAPLIDSSFADEA